MISKKAVATIREGEGDSEWLEIVSAPVRDPEFEGFIDCAGYYIQKKHTTKTPVWKW